MKSLIHSTYENALKHVANEGYNVMPVPGVVLAKISETSQREKRRWHQRLAIVLSGEKEIILESKVHHCTAGIFSFTPIDLPVISRFAEASKKKPFLAILIDLDPVVLTEIVNKIEKNKVSVKGKTTSALFVKTASKEMIETLGRLIDSFKDSESSLVLGPMIIKELLFHALKGQDGEAMRRFIQSGNKTYQISQAIHKIQSELEMNLNVDELAKLSSMSRAVFFKCFKDVTSMSPIQYQKRLRLIEAQLLLQSGKESAESAAFKVGYNSASQFSREYSRMFGKSPIRSLINTDYQKA